jgi:precorrin-6B C5,15-methyltransferase / cobalt-precorrin-6B C5,C15-methyltransferase
MTDPWRIIGILDDGAEGLTPKVLSHLSRADLIIGGARTLGLFAGRLADGAETRDLTGNLSRVPDWISEARSQGRRVVVLATGDPLCHGIAGFLQARLPGDACELFPNVSTIQLACARLGLPWQDLKICSVHGRDTGEWIEGAGPEHGLYPLLRVATQHRSLGVLTSAANTPDRIARMLVQEGLAGQFHLAVAERLLQGDERVVTDCSLEEAAGRRFADPNVVLLWRSAPPLQEVLFGLDDQAFRQRKPEKGLITKREVRAVSLARLQLRADSVVWDIGAGSGAVGLEAARLAHGGHVYAMEKNPEDLAIAAYNRRAMWVRNYTLLQGRAPEGLEAWPDPDAVFIGGSGGELTGLIALCLQRLKSRGTLVMNFATLENLSAATAALKQLGAAWDLTQIQVSRSRPILEMHRLVAENPIWILCAQREDGDPEQ